MAIYEPDGPRREPVPITDLLGSILGGISGGVDTRIGRLIADWERIAGERWRGTEPVGVKGGVLLVDVDPPNRISLLRFEVPELIDAIGAELGPDLVAGVRLRAARRRGREGPERR